MSKDRLHLCTCKIKSKVCYHREIHSKNRFIDLPILMNVLYLYIAKKTKLHYFQSVTNQRT